MNYQPFTINQVFMEPVLQTERLDLRILAEEDCQELFRITSSYRSLADFMTWNTPKNYEEVHSKFLELRKQNDQHFGIFDRETGSLVGRVTVRNFHLMQQDADKSSVFLSFWLSPEFQGKGYGTEMIKEIARYVFVDLKLRKLFAGTFAENVPSQKLLIKCGFREIGLLRKHYLKNGIFYDSIRFELLNEDFLGVKER